MSILDSDYIVSVDGLGNTLRSSVYTAIVSEFRVFLRLDFFLLVELSGVFLTSIGEISD